MCLDVVPSRGRRAGVAAGFARKPRVCRGGLFWFRSWRFERDRLIAELLARQLGRRRFCRVTTVVRPWYGRGTFNLARRCDRRGGSGLRPRLEDVRPVRTTHLRAWSWVSGYGIAPLLERTWSLAFSLRPELGRQKLAQCHRPWLTMHRSGRHSWPTCSRPTIPSRLHPRWAIPPRLAGMAVRSDTAGAVFAELVVRVEPGPRLHRGRRGGRGNGHDGGDRGDEPRRRNNGWRGRWNGGRWGPDSSQDYAVRRAGWWRPFAQDGGRAHVAVAAVQRSDRARADAWPDWRPGRRGLRLRWRPGRGWRARRRPGRRWWRQRPGRQRAGLALKGQRWLGWRLERRSLFADERPPRPRNGPRRPRPRAGPRIRPGRLGNPGGLR